MGFVFGRVENTVGKEEMVETTILSYSHLA